MPRAILLLKVEPPHEEEVAKAIAQLGEAKLVMETYGPYDVTAILEAPGIAELNAIISKVKKEISHIRHEDSTYLLEAKVHKGS